MIRAEKTFFIGKLAIRLEIICLPSLDPRFTSRFGRSGFLFLFLWLVSLLFWLPIISRAYVSMRQAVIINYVFTFYILRRRDAVNR